MAAVSYVQTDTAGTFNVGCSGAGAGATTAARTAVIGGSAGASEVSLDPGNQTTTAVFDFICGAPGSSATWAAGSWSIPLVLPTMDGGTIITAVHVCDWLPGTGYTSIASNTSPGHTRGATHSPTPLTVTVTQGSSHTPQSASLSQPVIIIVANNNDDHGGSGFGLTPSQTITTPIDSPAGGVAQASPFESAVFEGVVLR